MSVGLIVFFIAMGIMLLVVEFMLIPGITIAGIGGIIFIIGGVVFAFIDHGPSSGMLILGGTVLTMLIVTILILRAGTWKKLMLTSAVEGKADYVRKDEGRVSKGDKGRAVTRLNPVGKVEVNGEYYEAKAHDILVDAQTEIEVITVESNRLIVKPFNK